MVVSFSCLIKVIGYDITDTETSVSPHVDYSKSNTILNYFTHVFLNSVGGIEYPSYDFWLNDDDERKKYQ